MNFPPPLPREECSSCHLPCPLLERAWIRHQRWRVARARRDRRIVRLDVVSATGVRHSGAVRSSAPARTSTRLCRVRARSACADGGADQTVAANKPSRRRSTRASICCRITSPAGAAIAERCDACAGRRRRRARQTIRRASSSPSTSATTTVRVLIIVPASLREQWRNELRDRFGLASQMADAPSTFWRESLRVMIRGRSGIWIASPTIASKEVPHAALRDGRSSSWTKPACGDSDSRRVRRNRPANAAPAAPTATLTTAMPRGSITLVNLGTSSIDRRAR